MFKFVLIAAFVTCASSAAVSSDDVHAEVLAKSSDVRIDGFDTLLDLSNHIHHKATGDVHGNIQGEIGWISPEGVKVDITYTADDTGYHANGELLPTSPPIPQSVLKALAYIEAHPPKEEHHK